MATKQFLGTADPVAQVETGAIASVDGTPSSNTFTVSMGGASVSVPGNTDVNTTASDLRAALTASTDPYFEAITWGGAGASIEATAKTPGVEIGPSLTVSGGGSGSVTNFSTTTPNAGPSDWSTPENWTDGTIPANGDDVVIADSAVNIVYGLQQSAVALASLTIRKTYTGKIGLPVTSFATSADGETSSTPARPEYRQTYLSISATRISIGEDYGPANPTGSQRIKIDNKAAGASSLVVHDTAASASETGKTAVRYLAGSLSADVFVRNAPGGVGIGVDAAGEVATIGLLSVSHDTTLAFIQTGPGVTVTNVESKGGQVTIQAAATIAAVVVEGGTTTFEGDFAVTSLSVFGGIARPNNVVPSGDEIGTITIDGGSLDARGSTEPRTFDTVNLVSGSLRGNTSLTINTLKEPTAKDYRIQVEAA